MGPADLSPANESIGRDGIDGSSGRRDRARRIRGQRPHGPCPPRHLWCARTP